ncbi:MAG: hypothetical protein ACOX0Q_03565 [Syntrophomonadaceae bacterium]
MFREITVTCDQGRLGIQLQAMLTADGVAVFLTGGEKPHVGGMAMSVPWGSQPALKHRPQTWVTPRSGHRDADVAALVAEYLCREIGCCAAVIAGIHIDNATSQEIDLLVQNSLAAAGQLVEKLKQMVEID